MGSVTDKEIAKAREELNKIRANPELMERIRLQEAYEMDYNTAVDWAKKEKQLEIAKKMKAKGMTVDEIAELTELSPDEIEKLKE